MLVDEATMQIALPPRRFEFRPAEAFSDEEFFRLCQHNRDLRLERTAHGTIIVMPPAGGATGHRNHELTRQIGNWAARDGTGVAFDSSTGFDLPSGATRSPDAAWVRRERLADLSPEEKEHFLPLCPNFALELRSPSDALSDLQRKMEEYLENGCRLGWLIDPAERHVHVYRPGQPAETLKAPDTVPGDPALPGFTLDLGPVWDPDL